MASEIKIKILDDGTISIDTDSIDPTVHVSADKFLAEIEKLAGGQVTRTQKAKHAHQHSHVHEKVQAKS